MTQLRTRALGQIAMIMAIACLLATTNSQAQFASPPRTNSNPDAGIADLHLPSESNATLLSTAFTVLPIGVGVAMALSGEDNITAGIGLASFGLFIGPSIGYFYGGCTERGVEGIGLRAALSLTTVLAAAATAQPSEGSMSYPGFGDSGELWAVGLGFIALSSLYDIVKIRGAVRRQNRHRELYGVKLSPSLSPDGQTMGLQLSMAF